MTRQRKIWQETSGNLVKLQAGVGSAGCKIGTDSTTITGTAARDPYTVLLMHMNDAGLSDATSKVVSLIDGAARSAAQSKFGGYSALFDGNGDYLTVEDSDDFYFGTGAFSIDFWVRLSSSKRTGFCQQYVSADNHWLFQWDPNSGNVIALQIVTGGNCDLNFTCPWAPSTDTWYHVELTRGTNWHVFIDGVELAKTLNVGSYSASMPNLSIPLSVARNYAATTFDLNGYIDEFRIRKGIANHETGFSVPTAAYDYAYVSSDLVSSGSMSFAPASLGFTIDGSAKVAPGDLAAMDAACTIDYSTNASGGDGVTGFTGTPITPTAFTALAASTFASKSHLFLKFLPTASQVISAPKLTTQATATIAAQTGGMQVVVNSVTVFEAQDDGDVIAADITADDITMTGDLSMDTTKTTIVTATTTDATPTVLKAVALAADKTMSIDVDIIANKASTATKAKYRIVGTFYRNGSGNVTQLGDLVSLDTNEADTDWNATIVANTGDQTVDVQITGKAATTIAWSGKITYNVA